MKVRQSIPVRQTALLFAIGLAFSFASDAQTQKIGVLNIQAAIQSTREGKQALQELNAKVDPKRKELENRQNEIIQLEDQFRKGGAVMNDGKKEQLARSIEEKKKRLQRDTQDAEEEVQSEQQTTLQTLGQRMLAVITKYAKENGYWLVLDTSNPDVPVLYANTAMDITKEVAALYDQNPAPAAASTPSARPR